MMIPGIMAQRRVAAGGGTLWTPLNMAAVPQIYLDAQDSVVTIVSGTAAIISNLGAMGSDGDFSQGTADRRPTILEAELNGKRVLGFDGSNDLLLGASAAQKNLFRNAATAWVFSVHKKRTTDVSDTGRKLFWCSRNASASSRFSIDIGSSAGGGANKLRIGVRRLDGDSLVFLTNTDATGAAYVMTAFLLNYNSRLGEIYTNGSLSVDNATLVSAGNTSDTASTDALAIGAFVSGSEASDIDLAAIVISNAQPAAGDLEKLEGWAAHKYGLAANLPAEHPYKSSAPTI